MTRPFRFSVQSSGLPGAVDFIEMARRAEGLGYAAFGLPDHFEDQYAPMIALAAVAQATDTIELQPLVLANDYRHPVVLAKEAATLDVLSGGRFVMAIGAGWMRTDYDQAGMAYDRPGVRIARLEESVKVLKGLFAGEPFSFEGDHYVITEMTGQPKPVREPHMPFLIAGGGRKILSLAAREADIVGFNPGLAAGVIDERIAPTAHAEATDQKLDWVREAAGDRIDDIELQTSVFFGSITDDAQGSAEFMASTIGATAKQMLESPHVLLGTVDECIERVQTWRERWGISYISFSSDFMDDMAPVVAALAGT